MKKCSNCAGVGLVAAGAGLLLATFLPYGFIVCIEAVLLIAAGLILLKL